MRGKKNTENEIKGVRNESRMNEQTENMEQNTRIKIRNEGTNWQI